MVAAVAPDHRLAARPSIKATDLREEVWTAPSSTGLLARFCADHGFAPRIAFLTSDVLASRALIASGLCVTLTPRLIAQEFHGVAILPVRDAPLRALYAVVPEAGVSPLAQAMLAALAASITPPDGSATRRPAPSSP